MDSLSKVTISRNVSVKTYPFKDYFKGFEKVEAVKNLFGESTEEVLQKLRLEFYNGRGYMSFSDVDGHIRINADYLNKGDTTDLYLDMLHQLVHLKQFREGHEIFKKNLIWVDRTLEIEASQYAVDEARRLGMNDEEIFEYLRNSRISENDLHALAKCLKVKVKP